MHAIHSFDFNKVGKNVNKSCRQFQNTLITTTSIYRIITMGSQYLPKYQNVSVLK